MISLKTSIGEVEQRERLLDSARGALLAMAIAVCDRIVPAVPCSNEHRNLLLPVISSLRGGLSEEGLAKATGCFETAAASIGEAISTHRTEASAHIRSILTTLAEAAQILDGRTRSQSTQLQTFASSLEEAAGLDDLGEIRRRMTGEVSRLRSAVDALCRENAESAKRIETEISGYREKLVEIEGLVFRDEVTGLGNRRDAERAAAALAAAGSSISGILVDLNRFEAIIDRFGNRAADGLLSEFAHRLQRELRPIDRAFRWGHDQFLILDGSSLSDAMRRAFQLGPKLRGRFCVRVDGQDVAVEIGTSIGVAQCSSSESLADLTRRAETAIQAQRTIQIHPVEVS